jgi:hypothetical protein
MTHLGWNDGAYRVGVPLNRGHDVIRQVYVLVRVIHLLCDLHIRLSRKQGVDDHVFDGFCYPDRGR